MTSYNRGNFHARMYSPYLGRFLNVDPVSGVGGGSQRTNGYSYVMNNPLTFVDPDGRDLYVVYDFQGSGMSQAQQNSVVEGVRQRYRNAGVQRVYSIFKGSSMVPSRSSLGPSDARVDLSVTKKSLGDSTFGVTNVSAQSATVSTAHSPGGSAGVTFTTNVAAHEVGHGTQALSQYDADAAPKGSILHPNPAQAGTTMETGVAGTTEGAVGVLSSETREFSEDDAAQLRDALNPPSGASQ